MAACAALFQGGQGVPGKGGDGFGKFTRIEPADSGKLVRFGQCRLTLRIAGNEDQRNPVVAVLRIDKFAMAEKLDVADLKAGFFFGLAACCGEGSFKVIDLAARNAPVSGFRRLQAPA
ncbi:hypothetical protein D3C86_1833320 [compost metagenome]